VVIVSTATCGVCTKWPHGVDWSTRATWSCRVVGETDGSLLGVGDTSERWLLSRATCEGYQTQRSKQLTAWCACATAVL